MSKRSPVYLKWIDSHSPHGTSTWTMREDIETDTLYIDTVGYVIDENKRNVTIASQISCHKNPCCGGVMTIPKAAIVKRKKLK